MADHLSRVGDRFGRPHSDRDGPVRSRGRTVNCRRSVGGRRAAPAEDPGASPTKPDSIGGYVAGADVTGKATKVNGKVTLESTAKDAHLLKISVNIMWALIAGFLVMFMQAGFALVETGLTRAKTPRTRWR